MKVDPHLHLLVEWLPVKAPGLAEDVAYLFLRHAVIDDEVEADLGQRGSQLGGGKRHRAGRAGEIGPEIDDRNRLGRSAHSAAT